MKATPSVLPPAAPRDPWLARDLAAVEAAVSRYLSLLQEWLRIRSVRGDRAGLRAMATSVVDWCRARGVETRCEPPGAEPPLVIAQFDVGAAQTLLLYNMYDVMPADEAGWSARPFEGAVVDRADVGPSVMGRGAENNKGPLAGMLVALEAMLAASGTLPANVEVLVEGEEESGSGVLRGFLAEEPRLLRPAHTALFPSFCEYGGGPPRVFLGFKGIVHGTMRSAGGTWGGPRVAIHSSNAPWIASPVVAADPSARPAHRAADGRRRPERRGRAPGTERDSPRGTRPPFPSRARELAARHAARFAFDEPPAAALARVLRHSSLNLSRLDAGDATAPGVIPPSAEAGFDLRLAPAVLPARAVAELRGRLSSAGLDGVEITAFGQDAPGVSALVATYRALGVEPEIWPWSPGAAPAYAFRSVAPAFLIGGLGRGGNAHGTDEFVTLEGMRRFAVSLYLWLHHTARG